MIVRMWASAEGFLLGLLLGLILGATAVDMVIQ
jgi:hypothetical protein